MRDSIESTISYIRSMTEAQQEETVINGVSYWTDDQIQDIVDSTRRVLRGVPVSVHYSQTEENVTILHTAELPEGLSPWLEVIQIQDSDGNERIVPLLRKKENGTSKYIYNNITLKPPSRTIHLNMVINEDEIEEYTRNIYLEAWHYDIESVITSIWLIKASHRASFINMRGGGFSIQEDQQWRHCMEMHSLWSEKLNGIGESVLARYDYSINREYDQR